MSDKKKNPTKANLKRAVKRLEEALEKEKTPISRDSAIKRFELCYDLAWKAIKNYAKHEGVECNSPRSCFKEAYKIELIEYDEKWMEMVDDRNASVHIYREEQAEEIYDELPDYLEMLKKLLNNL